MAKRWTEEEDNLLLKLRQEGYTVSEMTHFIKDRTLAAIRSRISSIATDNKNRIWTEEEKALVIKLKSEGKSNKYIARVVDRTPRAVGAFIIRYWDNISSQTSV